MSLKSLKLPILKIKDDESEFVGNTIEISDQYQGIEALQIEDSCLLFNPEIKSIIRKLPIKHLIIHIGNQDDNINTLDQLSSCLEGLSMKLISLDIKYKKAIFFQIVNGDSLISILVNRGMEVKIITIETLIFDDKHLLIVEMDPDYRINEAITDILDLSKIDMLFLFNCIFTKEKMSLFAKLEITRDLHFTKCVFKKLDIDWNSFALNEVFSSVTAFSIHNMEMSSDLRSFKDKFRDLDYFHAD